jgi:predicted nucleic acid-binding protein
MNGIRTFIDTNILIYAFSSNEPARQKTAINYLDKCIPVISTQVVKEFTNVLLKKTHFDTQHIKDLINEIVAIVEVADEAVLHILKALELKEHYGYSFYDCLIIASAIYSNCTILLSEDMQNNQMVEEKLQIINPFKTKHGE